MSIRFTDTSAPTLLPIWEGYDECNPDGLPCVRVFQKAYEQAIAHLGASSSEQGGLLIGSAWASRRKLTQVVRIEIIEAVASPVSNSTEYSLRMGAEVWQAANTRLDMLRSQNQSAGSALRIIGWFHSHPNLGAFFSSTDRATQSAFFNHPYSIGWVIDPFSKQAAEHQSLYLGADSRQVSTQLVNPSLLNRL